MNVSTISKAPTRSIQKAAQLPLIRIIIGFLVILLPVAIGEMLIISSVTSSLCRSVLAMIYSIPAALAGYYVVVHFVERRRMEELEPSNAAREMSAGMVIGVLFSGGIMAILALAGAYAVQGTNSLIVLLPPLFFALKAAVVEEILFRGVFFRTIEERLGSWTALVISAVLFGALHLTNKNATPIGAIAIMLQAGFTMGAAFMLTRRLWLPIGLHFSWNFALSGVFASVVSGNAAVSGLLRATLSGPDWLTGGIFGIEGSILTLAVGLMTGIVLLWRARVNGNFIRR
jgi:membrane protease YdiL (CAAX protease family)